MNIISLCTFGGFLRKLYIDLDGLLRFRYLCVFWVSRRRWRLLQLFTEAGREKLFCGGNPSFDNDYTQNLLQINANCSCSGEFLGSGKHHISFFAMLVHNTIVANYC
mmetsp:Transcript_26692/g.54780  ORF Transcript_26692/g.54780 Transcript_26692/m.54780 type:complete len:107 (+) Transcript_26692:1226-1546(+)